MINLKKEEAIAIAYKYCLENEVAYCMDVLRYSPEESCDEWDI